MDLEIIKTVLTVVRLKSFSAAAYAIPCSQSSVSRRVEAAEQELGVRIFLRPNENYQRNIELTQVGERAVSVMEKIVDAYSELYKVVDASSALVTLDIGIRVNMFPPMGLSLIKADFFEENPDINISMKIDNLNVLLSEFRLRRLDAVLFSCVSLDKEKMALSEDIEALVLGTASISMGVSANNPISRKTMVKLEDLRDEVFLVNERVVDATPGVTLPNYDHIFDACKNSFTPRTRRIPHNMLDIKYKLALENKGIFPSRAPKPWRFIDGIKYLQVEDLPILATYYLFYRKGQKDAEANRFAAFFSARLNSE